MFNISSLRFIGIFLGLILLVISFFRLRSPRRIRTEVRLLIPFGLALILVAFFPGLVNLPSEILSLGNVPGGRILTLLIISNCIMYFLWFYERNKAGQRYLQVENLVSNLTTQTFFSNYSKKLPACPVTVLIPAYNEADNLQRVLPLIQKQEQIVSMRVLVIDDGSTDNTAKVASDFDAYVAQLPINRGGGAALKVGYDIIKRIGASVIVTMDADGQHKPEEINSLIEPILNDEADFIIGSRILGSMDSYSWFRYLGVKVFSLLINIIVGTKITDCSSGFRAFNLSILEQCSFTQEQYHTAELIIEASKRGFRLEERPIHISKRLSGKSKKGHNLKYALFFLRTIIKSWFK